MKEMFRFAYSPAGGMRIIIKRFRQVDNQGPGVRILHHFPKNKFKTDKFYLYTTKTCARTNGRFFVLLFSAHISLKPLSIFDRGMHIWIDQIWVSCSLPAFSYWKQIRQLCYSEIVFSQVDYEFSFSTHNWWSLCGPLREHHARCIDQIFVCITRTNQVTIADKAQNKWTATCPSSQWKVPSRHQVST